MPTGTVTLLFTDVEGSTQLLERLGAEAYAEALEQHRRLLRDAFRRHDGYEVDTQGDAFFVAFPRAAAAVAAAQEAQGALADGPVHVRVGIHTGEPIPTAEGYVGVDVHKGARIAAAGHGGQVLLSSTTRDLVEADVRDLGEHRLKDLTAPERLYQLGHDDFPPLKTIDATNLPVAASPLLGRERELDELLDLLRDGTRLVTVTGPGGTGKTRLALQVAAELVGSYEHGVFWVPLAALSDPELVVSQIAQTIGARGELAAHVRGKELLLLVDNLEHLLAAAPALGEVLAQAKGLRLLVTSRAPLHVRGEREYPLEPLAADDAVTLFVERAREAGRDLEPDQTVAAVCRRLDSLPLAIELAAARTRLLAPETLLERLDRALPLLTAGARDAPERQQTLRATIEWSYDLLDTPAKALFARLAVFAGTFSLEAAEDVCDADIEALAQLVDLNVLKPIAGSRFLMLETIREFAAERLESDADASATPKRHAHWYAELAKRAAETSMGALEHEWLVRLDADLENLRAAIHWARDHSEHLEVELVEATWFYLYVRGFYGEALGNLRHALETTESASLDQGELLHGAARVAAMTGDYAAAKRWCEQLLELARADNNARLIAKSLIGLAFMEADPERARTLYQDAADFARACGDTRSLASVAHNLGCIALEEDDPEKARPYLLEALELMRELSNEGGAAHCLSNLARVALAEGGLDEAAAFVLDALRLASHRGDKDAISFSLFVAAEIAAHRREAARAARLLGAADALQEEMGVRVDEYEKERARIAALLDGDGAALAAAESEGRALGLDEAVAYALQSLGA